MLIYSGVIEDEFIGWKEAIYACFYTAVRVALTKNSPVETKKVSMALRQLSSTEYPLVDQTQMVNYEPGFLTLHGDKPQQMAFP